VARDETRGRRGQDHGRAHGTVEPSAAAAGASSAREADDPRYSTHALGPDTWDDFAALVEANNGVWGGCWCMGFHPEGLDREDASANRDAKQAHVRRGTVRQMLVYAEGEGCVGWCQYGTPTELPNIKNRKAYARDLGILPDWRIGCIFTGKSHRSRGVARAGVGAALAEIEEAGGGLVEAYPEQVEGRPPQGGAHLHTGPEALFEEVGFSRDRRIAKWRWVMRLRMAG
jgi:GNAT superfamily N-acetyltransferase